MFETADAFRLYGVPVFQRRVATRQPLDLSVQRAYSRRLLGRQRSEVDLCKGRHGPFASTVSGSHTPRSAG